jgi:thiamine-phosphate pyrophosphorylase
MTDGRLGALRLVFVTPGRGAPHEIAGLVREVLDGGVTAVLLREPQLSGRERASLANEVVSACRSEGALALVSRDLELAEACGADGVHLGYGGPSPGEARRALPGRLVGRSAHWPLVADDLEADYLTLSPFRPTPRSHPRPLLTSEQLQHVLRLPGLGPVVALGGLGVQHVSDLPPGLAGVAVVRALADAPDPRTAAALLRSAIDTWLDFGGPREADRGL